MHNYTLNSDSTRKHTQIHELNNMFGIYVICLRVHNSISAYSYQSCIIYSEFLIRFRTQIPYLPNSELPIPNSKFHFRNHTGRWRGPATRRALHISPGTCRAGFVAGPRQDV